MFGQTVLVYGNIPVCTYFIGEDTMNPKIITALIVAAIICSAGTALALTNTVPTSEKSEVCPVGAHDISGAYIWTPVGTRSENFLWKCLRCGYTWTHSYPEDVYEAWRDAFLEPTYVRDYALLYLKAVLQMQVPDPLMLNWTGGRATPLNLVGYETYIYRAGGLTVTVGYPVVLPVNTVYTIKVEMDNATVWQGTLHRRKFESNLPNGNRLTTVYDYYGGVGVFERGIHVIATDYDPTLPTVRSADDYWRMLKEHETTTASREDFISLIVSRGDFPTGGYAIQVKSFSWQESHPVKLRFEVNFTNPGEGVAVTEALTNPLVLIPLGRLDPGEYEVQVHVDTYILTYDAQGKPVYTQILTFKEELWTQRFTVE
jgi:hypothetical protein